MSEISPSLHHVFCGLDYQLNANVYFFLLASLSLNVQLSVSASGNVLVST